MQAAPIKAGATTGRAASPCCEHTRPPQRRLMAPCCASAHGGVDNMQPSTPPEYMTTPNPLAERTNWQQPQPQKQQQQQQRRQAPSWKRPFQTQGPGRSQQQLGDPDRWQEVLVSPTGNIPRYVRYIAARLLEAPPPSAHLLLLANHAPAATQAVKVLAALDQQLAAAGCVALLQPALVGALPSSRGSNSSGGADGGGRASQQWQQSAAPRQRPSPPAADGRGGGAGSVREARVGSGGVPQLRLYLRLWPLAAGPSPYCAGSPQQPQQEADVPDPAADPASAATAGVQRGVQGSGGPPPLYNLRSPGRMGRTHLTSRATVPAQQAAFVLQDVMVKRGCYLTAAGGLAAANALLVLGLVRAALLRSSSWADLVVRVDKEVQGGERGQGAQPGTAQDHTQEEEAEGEEEEEGPKEGSSSAHNSSSSDSDGGQEVGLDGSSGRGGSAGPVVYRFTVIKVVRPHPGCRWPVLLAPVGPGWAPVRHVRAAARPPEQPQAKGPPSPARLARQQARRKEHRRKQQQRKQQQQVVPQAGAESGSGV